MGAPYEIPPVAGIVVNGGDSITIAVPFPSRTRITKILCVQKNGATDAFTVALFNNRSVLDGVVTSDSLGPSVGAIPEDNYRVTPDLSTATYGSAGKLLYFSELASGGAGYWFVNLDAPDADAGRRGINRRMIYVRITPAGAGDKEFCLSLCGETFDS